MNDQKSIADKILEQAPEPEKLKERERQPGEAPPIPFQKMLCDSLIGFAEMSTSPSEKTILLTVTAAFAACDKRTIDFARKCGKWAIEVGIVSKPMKIKEKEKKKGKKKRKRDKKKKG